MKTWQKRWPLLVPAFFLLAYVLPLGVRDLVDPDETRYAEIPREMRASGDWIVPRLNGVRYFEKPVLGYWLHAAAQDALGENSFAVRLPSALAVGGVALLVFGLARATARREEAAGADQDGPAGVAGLAALVYLSSCGVFAVGTTAVLDNLFVLFVTASIAAFFRAAGAAPGSRQERGLLVLSGLACGLALLTKGFLALALPMLVLGPWLLWERRLADLPRLAWLPLLTAALVVLPWGVAVHLKAPDFWPFFFWNEHVRRFFADNAQHAQPWWFLLAAAPGLCLPWTPLMPAALPGILARLRTAGPGQSLMRLCLCWLVLPFCLFSCSQGKLLTYILPCFPPLALVLAPGLRSALAAGRTRLIQAGLASNAALFGLVLVLGLGVQLCGWQGVRPYGEFWRALLAICSLLGLAAGSWLAWRSQDRAGKLLLCGLAMLPLFALAGFTLPDKTRMVKTPAPFLAANIPAPEVLVIADAEAARAVCWHWRRSDVYILGGLGEMEYGLNYAEARHRQIGLPEAIALMGRHPGRVVLVARQKHLKEWQDHLPLPLDQRSNGPDGYGIWRY